jgi:hypothetical protein
MGTPDEADAALTAWVKSLPHYPGRRTYLLEHIDGEWVLRRHEIELLVEEAIEEAFGLDPELMMTGVMGLNFDSSAID